MQIEPTGNRRLRRCRLCRRRILARETGVLRAAAESGDVPVLTYETARASLLDKRLAAIALTAAQAQGEAALEGVVGRLLFIGERQ